MELTRIKESLQVERTIPRNPKTRDMSISSDLPLLSSSETKAWGITSVHYLDLGVVGLFWVFSLFLYFLFGNVCR